MEIPRRERWRFRRVVDDGEGPAATECGPNRQRGLELRGADGVELRGADGVELRGADGEAHREIRALLWEDRLGQLTKRLKVALDRLPARKSAEPKVRLAAAMKAVSTVSNVWLAERLKMGRPARVSQYVRRFRLRGGGNAGSCKAAVPRVNT